jgi:uncharacterized membrane protein
VTPATGSPWFAGCVAAIQVAAILWCFARIWPVRHFVALLAAIIAVAAASAVFLGLPPVQAAGSAIAGGCHAVAYISLLLWFATSLRPDHEPVVTSLARRVRRTMPDKVLRYTRHVTVAWCIFFAAQLAVSAGLLLLAPHAVWAGFVTLLNMPLVATMVLAEFGVRMILFRYEQRTGLLGTLAAMRHRGAPRVKRS